MTLAETLGQPYDALLAHRELADSLGPDDQRISEHRAKAATLALRLCGTLATSEPKLQSLA